MPGRPVVAWLVGLLLLVAGSARGQGPNRSSAKFYPDSSDTAEALLRNAASHARDRQWSAAIEIYQRVIDQFGDKVARLPKDEPAADADSGFVLYVDDRRFCHGAIAHFPPEARAIYRNRVDGIAERWFRQGAKERDLALLRRVVDQAFCSSWGDDALELLGDLAFQDGRFGEALAMYRRLVPDRALDSSLLVHPDPTVDLAKVEAKKLICRAAAGDDVPAKAEIDAFARRHPAAQGALAGRTGVYATIIAQALESDHLVRPFQPDSRWPTFAGSLTRSKVVPGPVDVGSTQWRVELEKVWVNRQPTFGPRGMTGGPQNTPTRAALGLPSDRARGPGDCLRRRSGPGIQLERSPGRFRRGHAAAGRACLETRPGERSPGTAGTSHASGDSPVYAHGRGKSDLCPDGGDERGLSGQHGTARRGTSSIIALDWNTQGKKLWEQKSTSLSLPDRPPDRNGNNGTVSFEGTPVANTRNVYVAVTDRREQTATYVACFDADTGASRWIRYLGAASPDVNNMFGMGMPMQFGMTAPGDFNHRLLTLDGPALYYQTNLGAVVALEAETGATLVGRDLPPPGTQSSW